MSQSESFDYSVTNKASIVIVSFAGDLAFNALDAFERCREEVLSLEESRFVVLDFSQLRALTLDAIPAFTLFQRSIRERGTELRLSAVSEDLKLKLTKLGVVRHSEIAPDLKDALLAAVRGVRSQMTSVENEKSVDEKKSA